MITKLFRTFILAYSTASIACVIELPSVIVTTGKPNPNVQLKNEDCSPGQLLGLSEVLCSQRGQVPVGHIQASQGDGIVIRSTSSILRVVTAEEIFRTNFLQAVDENTSIEFISGPSLMALNGNGKAIFSCTSCQFNGTEELSLKVFTENDSVLATHPLSVKFSRMITALKLRQDLKPFNEGLNASMFEQVRVSPNDMTPYLSQPEELSFYRTNKSLRAGEILRRCDLAPKTLVRAGQRVDVVWENAQLKLKSQATSKQVGGFGDVIEIWNQANGRKYRAKVIDFNRVVIEL